MFLSVYLSRNSTCAAYGSFRSIFNSLVRFHERYSPDASRNDTLKSSILTSVPVTAGPEPAATVIVTGFVRCGNRNRCCNVGGSYLRPIPARSPDAEWHVLHLPAPLKYSAPAFAFPVRTFCTRYVGELLR